MSNYPHLAHLFRQKAIEFGEKTALGFPDPGTGKYLDLSWKKFSERIDQAALALLEAGVEVHEKVAIVSRNMPEWTMADLALMSIKAISVPIFATDSVEQIHYILKETSVRLVFCGEQEQYDKLQIVNQLLGRKLRIVAFDTNVAIDKTAGDTHFSDFVSSDNTHFRDELKLRLEGADMNDLATIIYTSGTSGEPKGVMLHYRNFSNTFRIHDEFLHLRDDEVSLTFLPLSHIFERTWSLYALYRGIKVIYMRNPREVVDVMQVVKPTIMCTVPRFFEKTYNGVMEKVQTFSPAKRKIFFWAVEQGKALMEAKRTQKPVSISLKIKYLLADKLVLDKARKALGGRIRFMPCSGSALSDQLNIFFHSLGIHVKYAYGLTETLATVTAFRDEGFRFGTVGKPLAGIQLKISDEGEILIKGDSLFSGYYNKEVETGKVFTDGWFRTGDAGRIDEDGHLVMTERLKDLIKTSTGKFVAPQQVESKLSGDPYISQIIVIGDNRRFISALIVPSAEKICSFAQCSAIPDLSYEELIRRSDIVDFIQQRVNYLQEDLADFQKIKRIALLSKEFSIESGEFTSTLKLRRKFVEEKYKTIIERLYEETI